MEYVRFDFKEKTRAIFTYFISLQINISCLNPNPLLEKKVLQRYYKKTKYKNIFQQP